MRDRIIKVAKPGFASELLWGCGIAFYKIWFFLENAAAQAFDTKNYFLGSTREQFFFTRVVFARRGYWKIFRAVRQKNVRI